jgi:hypothetical protein
VISNEDVQHIDVVPTIADLLGLQVPWAHEGRSVFKSHAQMRQKVAYLKEGTRVEFPANLGLLRTGVRLEAPAEVLSSPWIGQEVATFHVGRYEEVKGVLDPVRVASLDREGKTDDSPVYVSGWVFKPKPPDEIVVAVNGTIVAVTPRSRASWATSFHRQRLREGLNLITAYVVVDANQKKLALLSGNTIRIPTSRHRH